MNKRVSRKLIYSKMNKKGFFLAEETMKILLAVICLGFLIFVLGKMYYSYTVDKEVQQAKDTLAHIEKEINLLKDGEQREIVIYSPGPGKIINSVKNIDYWVLTSFSGAQKPVFCSEKGWESCLCICKNSWSGNMISKCDRNKICVSLSGKTSPIQPINLENLPISIIVKQTKEAIGFSKESI